MSWLTKRIRFPHRLKIEITGQPPDGKKSMMVIEGQASPDGKPVIIQSEIDTDLNLLSFGKDLYSAVEYVRERLGI